MKIPLYVPKQVEELARAVAVAVGTYLVMSITAGGLPTTQEGVISVLAGALPIAWAALRAALNRTPLTPDQPAAIDGYTPGTKP